jgi:hypothetical protein
MTWQGGTRKQADIQLFRRAGIEVGNSVIFQFYPKPIENQLAVLERDFARGRPTREIRKTYFTVNRAGRGYEFAVKSQTYTK